MHPSRTNMSVPILRDVLAKLRVNVEVMVTGESFMFQPSIARNIKNDQEPAIWPTRCGGYCVNEIAHFCSPWW